MLDEALSRLLSKSVPPKEKIPELLHRASDSSKAAYYSRLPAPDVEEHSGTPERPKLDRASSDHHGNITLKERADQVGSGDAFVSFCQCSNETHHHDCRLFVADPQGASKAPANLKPSTSAGPQQGQPLEVLVRGSSPQKLSALCDWEDTASSVPATASSSSQQAEQKDPVGLRAPVQGNSSPGAGSSERAKKDSEGAYP